MITSLNHMKIDITTQAAQYLERSSTRRILIDMKPDMTSSGCGCGKSKKYYTPYIRQMKQEEFFKNYRQEIVGDIEVFLSPKALEAAQELVTIRLEKTLFIKNLEVDGIQFIVE